METREIVVRISKTSGKMKSEEKPQRPPVLMSFTEVKPYLYLSGFGCITEKAVGLIQEKSVIRKYSLIADAGLIIFLAKPDKR